MKTIFLPGLRKKGFMGIYILPGAIKNFNFVLHLEEKDSAILVKNF